jgi:hypothetical protein
MINPSFINYHQYILKFGFIKSILIMKYCFKFTLNMFQVLTFIRCHRYIVLILHLPVR